MALTTLTKYLIGAAAVGGGGLYLYKRRKKKKKKKVVPEAVPEPPRPTVPPRPGVPPTPAPEAVVPAVQPPSGWSETFNNNVDAVIEQLRATEGIMTLDDVQRAVGRRLFPDYQWPPPEGTPSQNWQMRVWGQTASIVVDKAKALADWPFFGSAKSVRGAVTYYLAARKSIGYCMGVVPQAAPESMESYFMLLQFCAVERMYPDIPSAEWPPTGQRSWRHVAWDMLARDIATYVPPPPPEPGPAQV